MFIFYFIGSAVKIACFFFFLPKGRQTSNELERNMNEGTIVYLTSLLIVLT